MSNGDYPAFPMYNELGNLHAEGLTKRETFAAMVKTPDFILQQEMDLWRGDGNKLPQVGSIEYCKMMKAIAAIDSAYAIYKADALLTQLNPQP